jgi:hypothetical protein
MAKASDNPFPSVLVVEGSAPSSPSAGNQRVFIDTADHKLKRVNSSGTVTTIEGSVATALHGCCAERTNTSMQSIANATITAVALTGTDLYDTDSIHDPSVNNTRLTIPTGLGGVWQFRGTAVWDIGGGGNRLAFWNKNGTALDARYGRQDSSGSYASAATSVIDLTLSAGDYIEFVVYQDSGSAKNLYGSTVSCHFLG